MKHALLAKRYAGDAWAYFEEVPNGTGYAKRKKSFCDALALSLYPSRGIHLHGHEVKASRSDWLRELKNPAKADEIARYCHYWWIVAYEPGIVKFDEIPPTWGLLEAHDARGERELRVVKPAPLLEPLAMDPFFVAAIARCAARAMDGMVTRDEYAKLERDIHQRAAEIADLDQQMLRGEIEQVRRERHAAEEELRQWKQRCGAANASPALVEQAIAFAMLLVRSPWGTSRVRQVLSKFLEIADGLKEMVDALEAFAPPAGAEIPTTTTTEGA